MRRSIADRQPYRGGITVSYDSWTCLAIEKGGALVHPFLAYTLKAAACKLKAEGREQMFFASDECDGLIKTTGRTYRIGGRSGILFAVECSIDGKDWQINFLLNEKDLEQGAKFLEQDGELPPEIGFAMANPYRLPDDLYQFHDLRTRTIN